MAASRFGGQGLQQLEKAPEVDPEHPRAREIFHSLGGNPEELR